MNNDALVQLSMKSMLIVFVLLHILYSHMCASTPYSVTPRDGEYEREKKYCACIVSNA